MRRTNRKGFSLAEMMITVVLMGIVMSVAVKFFRSQSMAISSTAGRFDAYRNAQYAALTIDRDLRVAGIGVTDKQPILLQADAHAITFNANVTANTAADDNAVYIDLDADSASTGGLVPASKVTLPLTSWMYPDSLYLQAAGIPTNAETISYWVRPDVSRPGESELVRRVNDGPIMVVSKGLVITAGVPTFRYYYGPTDSVAAAALPMLHTLAIHNSTADTGSVTSRLIDSVRYVRVQFQTQFKDPRMAKPVLRSISSLIRIANAGLVNRTTCGDVPILGSTFSAVASGSPPKVTLTWTRAVDEAGGEKDVERYAIYRHLDTAAASADPMVTVPAGAVSYSYVDNFVNPGERWMYLLSAIDCTPTLSPAITRGPVIIP
jgi:prepilin-type N-terminal cleavage/methylation domain-containing protein